MLEDALLPHKVGVNIGAVRGIPNVNHDRVTLGVTNVNTECIERRFAINDCRLGSVSHDSLCLGIFDSLRKGFKRFGNGTGNLCIDLVLIEV